MLAEDEYDHSPYDPGRSIFHAIVNDRAAEHDHGPLVRFSLIGEDERYDIDWRDMPPGAEPVYFRRMESRFAVDGSEQVTRCIAHHFGWRGDGIEEIREIGMADG